MRIIESYATAQVKYKIQKGRKVILMDKRDLRGNPSIHNIEDRDFNELLGLGEFKAKYQRGIYKDAPSTFISTSSIPAGEKGKGFVEGVDFEVLETEGKDYTIRSLKTGKELSINHQQLKDGKLVGKAIKAFECIN